MQKKNNIKTNYKACLIFHLRLFYVEAHYPKENKATCSSIHATKKITFYNAHQNA